MRMRALHASCLAAMLVALTGGASTVQAQSDLPLISLSNSFYVNTWRRQMVEAFEAAAEQAKAEGKIADYVVLNGDGSVNQQNSQLAELILRGVDAIAINAASETALNGVAEKACEAGIAVIAFDSLLTAPCAYTLSFDFTQYKTTQSEATLDLIGGQGKEIGRASCRERVCR